jgi:putative iron-dependent peroxidase
MHDFQRFDAMSSKEQDNSVGRRKSDNKELTGAPRSSHVKRTAQESFSPEAFITCKPRLLRRGTFKAGW